MYSLLSVNKILPCLILITIITTGHGTDDCLGIDYYNVSSDGKDDVNCTLKNSNTSCETFQYLIQHIENSSCMVISIVNDTEQNISERLTLTLSDISIIGVTTDNESANVTLTCEEGSGILFDNSQRIHLENLMFVSCGVNYSYPNTVYKNPITEYAAVYFYRGSDIQVTGCSFLNSSGTGIIMDDVIGSTSVCTTNFTDNESTPGRSSTSGGLIIKRQHISGMEANYNINNSSFVNSAKIDENQPGSGIALYLNASNSTTCICLLTTVFSNNHAPSGAGMLIDHSGSNHMVRVSVYNSIFTSNRALREGGGISVQIHGDRSNFSLYLNNCHFYSNTAKWGGGLATYVHDDAIGTNINVTAEESEWDWNTAETHGYGVVLSSALDVSKPSKQTKYMLQVHFSHCTFMYNKYKDHSDSMGTSTVYINSSRADFSDCYFNNNYGSALYLSQSSYATFSGHTRFISNRGTYGGAVYVDSDALIALKENVTLLFRDNYASINGGVIYTEVQDENDHDSNNCIFESLFDLLQSSDSYNVSFLGNLVGLKYQSISIFVGNPSGCIDTVNFSKSVLLNRTKMFNYVPNNKAQITSPPINVALYGENMSKSVKFMLGERFNLYPTSLDAFNNSVYIPANITLPVNNNFNLELNDILKGVVKLYPS